MKIFRALFTSFFTFIVKHRAASCGNIKANRYCAATRNTFIGDDCHFNGFKIYGRGKVVMGNRVHVAKGLQIFTTNHNYEGKKLPYDETTIDKDVTIADNVWIGADVTILGGISIGEGAIIQAGSVVVNDIPALGIAGGHPAHVFKYRNDEHYYKLKHELYHNDGSHNP